MILAAGRGHLKAVRFLVANGADIHIKNPKEWSKNMDWITLRCTKENFERIDDAKHKELMDMLRDAGAKEE